MAERFFHSGSGESDDGVGVIECLARFVESNDRGLQCALLDRVDPGRSWFFWSGQDWTGGMKMIVDSRDGFSCFLGRFIGRTPRGGVSPGSSRHGERSALSSKAQALCYSSEAARAERVASVTRSRQPLSDHPSKRVMAAFASSHVAMVMKAKPLG